MYLKFDLKFYKAKWLVNLIEFNLNFKEVNGFSLLYLKFDIKFKIAVSITLKTLILTIHFLNI